MLSSAERRTLLAGMVDAACEAGELILRHYAQGVEHRTKADKSPITIADEEAEALILAHLARIAPGVPVVAEELAAAGKTPDIGKGAFFLVDPLDGTKEFLSRNGEFTVNIALIEQGAPTAGVVFAPAKNRLFWGTDNQAFEQASDESGKRIGEPHAIAARKGPREGLIAIASRSHRDRHTDDFLAMYAIAQMINAGSSLKFCVIAAGEADIYPRHGTTMEWDTAAGDAVLRAAGGIVTYLDRTTPLRYGKVEENFTNPHFVAIGKS
jgi:3'(2'), 5'-bisphosphate nucleotidase